MAHWKRLGQIFTAQDGPPWMASHASVPFAVPMENSPDTIRIYFTPRDSNNRSQIAWLDCALGPEPKVLAIGEDPVLGPGERGAFDDCGAMTSWVTAHAGQSFHYYIGWNVRNTVPFHNSVGLAVLKEADSVGHAPSLEERLTGPVLDRSQHDPFFCSNPCVLRDGDLWLMWYISGTGWLNGDDGGAASYVIKKATSVDGMAWTTNSGTALGLSEPHEVALARPSVMKEGDQWHMWFSYRSDRAPYRIGYAHSSDGETWLRDDKARGFDTAKSGWDSEMVCYPHVFRHGPDLYMLYCGNGYSQDGFGVAVWKD